MYHSLKRHIMKSLNKIFKALPVAGLALAAVGCNDVEYLDQPMSECYIMSDTPQNSLSVIGRSGDYFSSRMSNDTIYIKVNPQKDVNYELDGVVPKFFISMGATVTPDPSEPQNFAVEGGVKYTVTSGDGKTQRTYVVTHCKSDVVPYGEGFTFGKMFNEDKLVYPFTNLGYPGEKGNFNFSDSRLYGDLNGYIAFCGREHVVLVAQQYLNPVSDNNTMQPDLEYGIRVYKFDDLSYAGKLNYGPVAERNIRTITSDWAGNMVAAVNDGKADTKTDIYYWETPTSAPVHVGTVNVNLAMCTDGSNYLQVAGNIKEKANIAAAAMRGVNGDHTIVHVENGAIDGVTTLSTGFRSDDCTGFQMISPMSSESGKLKYIIGDNEPPAGNNAVKVYVKDDATNKISVMPAVYNIHWAWWVGTGQSLSRGGSKRPFVTTLPINGRNYNMVLNGSGWWWGHAVYSEDMQSLITPNLQTSDPINAGWSFGATADWFWDEKEQEAYVVIWTDRMGIHTAKMTCYE